MIAEDARHSAQQYLSLIGQILNDLDIEAVLRVCARIHRVREAGGTIYVAGNGGSAATASHWTNDLGKATRSAGVRPIRVVCLSDHTSWLTALANDEGYDRVFSGQLESHVRPGDLLVVISASGNSPNLIEGVRTAQSLGAAAVALLGFDGGALKSMVDDCVWLPTPKGAYGPVEDGHAVVCHLVTTILARTAAAMAPAAVATSSRGESIG
jgi:D-sedoheptulose 7-phosphate isomerase